jgi:hypothetical protein
LLESLLIDTCSFLDSLSQTLIREKSVAGHVFNQQSQIVDFNKKVSSSAEFNFGDYRELFESEFALSTREVNVNLYEDALYSNPVHYAPDQILGFMIAPFKEWREGASSPWWRAFTDLKHDRMEQFPRGNA